MAVGTSLLKTENNKQYRNSYSDISFMFQGESDDYYDRHTYPLVKITYTYLFTVLFARVKKGF